MQATPTMLALLLAVTSASAETRPDRVCAIDGFQASMMLAINQARSVARTCGQRAMPAAAPLGWNGRLFDAAARHADDMARHGGSLAGSECHSDGCACRMAKDHRRLGYGTYAAGPLAKPDEWDSRPMGHLRVA